jgi:N-acyl-phosphatidylethanolamine-hydrolysing phospholipase D
MMSRRQFIQKMLVSFKGLALMSAVSPLNLAAQPEAPGNGVLHYRPLNGRSLREMAEKKVHHGNGHFQNPIGIPRNGRFWQVMSWKLFHRNAFEPYLDDQPTTAVTVDWQRIRSHTGLSVTFLKHASVLIRDVDRYLLVDPVFGSFFWFIKDFSPLQFDPREIPRPDQVLITHGHYDHLDTPSLDLLDKDTHVISPLGYDEILDHLKFKNRKQLDWYDSHKAHGSEIIFLPSNHWTIRNPLEGPNRALWGSYLIKTAAGPTLYLSGDTAYFDGFSQLGREFAIDLAIFNLGAYEPRWFMAPSHANPSETLRAFKELGAKKLMIVHWGTFRLGDEPVHFPPMDIRKALEKEGLLDRLVDLRHGDTYFFP